MIRFGKGINECVKKSLPKPRTKSLLVGCPNFSKREIKQMALVFWLPVGIAFAVVLGTIIWVTVLLWR